jgi:3-oxoacyl-[acyl-carrier protein] reductase
MSLLEGKVVVVTGGGHGIGADICRVLSEQGAAVAINYSASRDLAMSLAAELESTGGRARAFGADVRIPTQVDTMVKEVCTEYGRVDGIVNNAINGTQHSVFDNASLEDYATAFDFGCAAVVNTVRAVRPIMCAQGGGRIINIVTELWNMAPAEWSVYLAGKGAMVGVSRSLAAELGPENITVNMVAPGWMVTDKVDTTSEGSIGFAKSVPMRRHGSAREIGNACAFLVSDLASYITGAYIPVTGGRVTQMGG